MSSDNNGEILKDPAAAIAAERLYEANESALDLERLAAGLDDEPETDLLDSDTPTPTVDELLEAA